MFELFTPEGAFVGLVSKYFQEIAGFQGIVLQAVVATFGVFFLMAFLYNLVAALLGGLKMTFTDE